MHNIVITGGSSGIGAATVARLLLKNCQIYNLDTQKPPGYMAGTRFIHTDLALPESIDKAIEQLPHRLDALINVAGISGSHPLHQVLSVNFLGLRHITESLLKRLASGCVVNVASSAGRDWRDRGDLVRGMLSTENFASGLEWIKENAHLFENNPYKFSKQCAAAYTYRAAGLGLAHSVRVNCVNPGVVGTGLTADFRAMIGSNLYDSIIRKIGREGTPEDIAPIIEFLSIGESSWLNGVEIAVDGGYIAGIIDGWITPPTNLE
jgi:NAD(P)-dependent dehydrogenase (short-subunit alcohol dehydrogenase family)